MLKNVKSQEALLAATRIPERYVQATPVNHCTTFLIAMSIGSVAAGVAVFFYFNPSFLCMAECWIGILVSLGIAGICLCLLWLGGELYEQFDQWRFTKSWNGGK